VNFSSTTTRDYRAQDQADLLSRPPERMKPPNGPTHQHRFVHQPFARSGRPAWRERHLHSEAAGAGHRDHRSGLAVARSAAHHLWGTGGGGTAENTLTSERRLHRSSGSVAERPRSGRSIMQLQQRKFGFMYPAGDGQGDLDLFHPAVGESTEPAWRRGRHRGDATQSASRHKGPSIRFKAPRHQCRRALTTSRSRHCRQQARDKEATTQH